MLSRPHPRLWLALLAGLLAWAVIQVDQDDDPRLYYEVAGQVLNRPVDEAYLHRKRGNGVPPAAPTTTDGQALPYRDFPVEYPPLALGILVLPRVFTHSPAQYMHLFQGMMAAAYVAAACVGARLLARLRPEVRYPRHWALLLSTLLLALTGSYIVRRFDVLLSLTVAASTLAMVAANPFAAGLLLGGGAALKLWPALLLPLLALYDRRPRTMVRLLLGFAILPLLSHLVLYPLIGSAVLNYLGFHAGRGLQIESLWASLLMPLGRLLHLPADAAMDHGSINLSIPILARLAIPISYVVAIGTLLASYVAGHFALRRCEEEDRPHCLTEAIVLLVAGLIITAKVLSPQYLLWLFPLALLVRDDRAVVAYLLAIACTRLYFPSHYDLVIDMTSPGMLILLIRNLALAALVITLLRSMVQRPAVGANPDSVSMLREG